MHIRDTQHMWKGDCQKLHGYQQSEQSLRFEQASLFKVNFNIFGFPIFPHWAY